MAHALGEWLLTDPTNSGDTDFLVTGDLNAYAREDPIAVFQDEYDFTNLLEAFGRTSAYTYRFRGEAGYLEHALASSSLLDQVADVAIWHINADEATVFDYRPGFGNVALRQELYSVDPFRSSDHDPIVVDIRLR